MIEFEHFGNTIVEGMGSPFNIKPAISLAEGLPKSKTCVNTCIVQVRKIHFPHKETSKTDNEVFPWNLIVNNDILKEKERE